MAIKFRSAFGYDEKQASREAALSCEDESLTVQSDMEDADINTIVRRFGLTGEMPGSVRLPSYEDYDQVFDFRTAQQALIDARDSFMGLPAHVRSRFDNDPQAFLEFVVDPANVDEAVALGLAVKKTDMPLEAPEKPQEPPK